MLIANMGRDWCSQNIFKVDLSSSGLIVPLISVKKSAEAGFDNKTEGKAPDASRNSRTDALVKVVDMEGGYHVQLEGAFNLTVKKDDRFWLRLVILFLRQLEGISKREGSRATRDGRRPLFTQQQMVSQGLGQPVEPA